MHYFSTLLFALLAYTGISQTTIINATNTTTGTLNGSFENATSTFAANGWTAVNDANSIWYVGTNSKCAGTKAAYVGTVAGAGGNNNYVMTTSYVSHFYKDVTFPAGLSCITFSFSWKGQGESVYDGLKVYFGSTAVTPVAGTLFSTSDASAYQAGSTWYNLQGTCQTVTLTLPASFAGTSKRLVFSWVNDNSAGTNPAATVDAVSLIAQAPVIPTCATGLTPANGTTGVTQCTSLSWTAPVITTCDDATSYDVYFGTTATPPFYVNTTATSISVPLNGPTVYYWKIVPRNSAGPATGCSTLSFTTATPPNPQYVLSGSSTSASPYNCVTLTANTVNQNGCAWDINSTLNFLANFTYDFDINLGSSDAGADGMAFVIQNDPLGRCKCGTPGNGLGAGGIQNSLVIEIDTYLNTEDRDDFVSPLVGCAGTEDPDHLDIWINGNINPDLDGNCDAVAAGERPTIPNAVRLQNPPGTDYNIENGLNHKLRISWNAATSTITATIMDAALSITYGTASYTFNPTTLFGTSAPFFGFTASTGGLSNQQTFCLPGTLLPVTLSSFDVVCEGVGQLLTWTTQSEDNNDHFTIERSCDGVHFSAIATIPGHGSTSAMHAYQYTDREFCEGVNYYRLSQTDFNGKHETIGVRSVASCDKPADFIVYPNPATEEVVVAWETNAAIRIDLTDAAGKLIRSQAVADQQKQLVLDLSNVASGLYTVTLVQATGNKHVKLVVE